MDGQEPTNEGQPTPQPPTQPEQAPAPEKQTPEPKTFTEDYVKELRQEAAKHRTELRKLQEQFAALQTEKESREKAELEQQGEFKTLAEKAQQEAAKLKQQLQEREAALIAEKRNNLVISIAGRLEAHDPADPNFLTAAQAVDMSGTDAAEQIEKIIQAMKETKSYLFKQAPAQQQQQRALTPFNPTGQPGPIRETDEQRRARLYGGGSNIFDPEAAAQHGGGVVWPKGKPAS